MEEKPNYYLIAVSNRKNLELCIRYGIAGFMNSISGAWTFLDINEGDFITFIYGARAFNLYKVSKKVAIVNADGLPPWDNIKFRETGNTYYFPFRFELELIREFNESIVRYEFTYVAENLLLRGGYRKTHFQADQTTLQNVSSMGKKSNNNLEQISYPKIEKFTPLITFDSTKVNNPLVYKFKELFLQSTIKHYLSKKQNMSELFNELKYNTLKDIDFEILSEKALPQGHVDILLKEAIPMGTSKQIVVEVKTNKASLKDLVQLTFYMEEIGDDCVGGILIANDFQRNVIAQSGKIKLVKYSFSNLNKEKYSIQELVNNLRLEVLG